MGLIGALKAFDQAYVFGMTSSGVPGGPARATLFYVLNLYLKAFNYFHMGLASAMAWLLFLTIVSWLTFQWIDNPDSRRADRLLVLIAEG